MAATNAAAPFAFGLDMPLDDTWLSAPSLPQAPFPASILDELHEFEAPQPPSPHRQCLDIHAPSPPSSQMSPVTPTNLPVSRKRSAPSFPPLGPPPKKAFLSNFSAPRAKTEPCLEPLTPSASQRDLFSRAAHGESSCSDEDDVLVRRCSVMSSDAAAAAASLGPLPLPNPCQAAKRRASRMRALKRSRALTAARADNPMAVAGEVVGEDDDEIPVDKKVARAIRNRQAAQRSRVEAKLKMQSLSDANDVLAGTVQVLKDENESLNRQLRGLMEHTFGAGVSADQVLSVFGRLKEEHEDGSA